MIAHMIRSKASVPRDTIQENMETDPIVTDAMFQSMTGIQWRCQSKVLKNCTRHQNSWLNMELLIVGMLKTLE